MHLEKSEFKYTCIVSACWCDFVDVTHVTAPYAHEIQHTYGFDLRICKDHQMCLSKNQIVSWFVYLGFLLCKTSFFTLCSQSGK